MSRLERFLDSGRELLRLHREIDDLKVNQGRILAQLHAGKSSPRLSDYEFRVFSQSGEDGIIQFLISSLRIENRTFIEFGTEDFHESNCRFLLVKDDWSGFVIDGSERNMERLRGSAFFWRHPLACKSAFITRENIAGLLEESGFAKRPGILSIDIDGVDYHVLAELRDWLPSIFIVEYNALFGKRRAVSVPYDPMFQRGTKHHSNLYYGASLPAFAHLLGQRNYALVGANSTGNNAFFVRRDLLNERVKEVSLAEGFRESRFREGRDRNGHLTFESANAGRRMIEDLPLIDVISGEGLKVCNLPDE
jgi:hypothetical protein